MDKTVSLYVVLVCNLQILCIFDSDKRYFHRCLPLKYCPYVCVFVCMCKAVHCGVVLTWYPSPSCSGRQPPQPQADSWQRAAATRQWAAVRQGHSVCGVLLSHAASAAPHFMLGGFDRTLQDFERLSRAWWVSSSKELKGNYYTGCSDLHFMAARGVF